jgi:hypothetical protein
MMPFNLFPIPPRGYARTDSYRIVSGGSYRTICRLITLLIGLQLITLAAVLAGAIR